jgi:hypothetical protein
MVKINNFNSKKEILATSIMTQIDFMMIDYFILKMLINIEILNYIFKMMILIII